MKEILTKDQLFRFNKCYAVYQKKDAVGAAKKAFKKLDPDDDLTEKIQQAIIAQNVSRKKNPVAREFLPSFGPWLNAQRWLDEIPGSNDKQQSSPLGNCQCGKPVDYAYSKRCMQCEGKHIRDSKRQETADILTKMGIYVIGDTKEELNAKCRKYIKENKNLVIENKVMK